MHLSKYVPHVWGEKTKICELFNWEEVSFTQINKKLDIFSW